MRDVGALGVNRVKADDCTIVIDGRRNSPARSGKIGNVNESAVAVPLKDVGITVRVTVTAKNSVPLVYSNHTSAMVCSLGMDDLGDGRVVEENGMWNLRRIDVASYRVPRVVACAESANWCA